MKHRIGLMLLFFSVSLSAHAFAQQSVQRFERQLEQIRRDTRDRPSESVPLEQRTYFDYGAFTTFNYLSLDDPSLKNRGLREYDITAYARLNLDGVHEFFIRGREFFQDFNNGDSLTDDVNGWDGRVERAYYKFDLARYLAATKGTRTSGNLTIKAGRDLAYWANGLTLSQEIDGGVVDLEYGPLALELLGGITPLDTVDIDSSRPDFNERTKRGFYGAMLSARVGTHRPFVYGLIQRDFNGNDMASTDLGGGLTVNTDFDYNSFYIGIGSTGALTDRLMYGIEAVYEGGESLSSSFAVNDAGFAVTVPQERDDIQAWALDARLDYLFPDRRHTRASAELILASGDHDRFSTTNTLGGNRAGTNDHAFNAFGLLNTGLAFAPAVSNLIALRGGFATYPLPDVKAVRRMQVGTDIFLFAKMQRFSPIDEPTTDDRFLGVEPDVFVNWQLTSDLTLALRYGAFIPGDAIVNDDKIRQFFYAGVTFAF